MGRSRPLDDSGEAHDEGTSGRHDYLHIGRLMPIPERNSTHMQPVAPGAGAGAAGAPPAVEQHGGDGSWSHLMSAPAAATARSQAQVDLGMCCSSRLCPRGS
jgi:hypothetical protein